MYIHTTHMYVHTGKKKEKDPNEKEERKPYQFLQLNVLREYFSLPPSFPPHLLLVYPYVMHVCVCMYVYVRAYPHIDRYVLIRAHIIYLTMYMYVYTYISISSLPMYTHTHIYTYTHMYTCIYVYIYIYIYVCVCVCISRGILGF